MAGVPSSFYADSQSLPMLQARPPRISTHYAMQQLAKAPSWDHVARTSVWNEAGRDRIDTQETAWSPSANSPDQVSMALLQQQITQLRQDLERDKLAPSAHPGNLRPQTMQTYQSVPGMMNTPLYTPPGMPMDPMLTSLSQELIQQQLLENQLKQQLLEQQIKHLMANQTSSLAHNMQTMQTVPTTFALLDDELSTLNKYATLPRAAAHKTDSSRWEPTSFAASKLEMTRLDSTASYGSIGEEVRFGSLGRNKISNPETSSQSDCTTYSPLLGTREHLPFLSLPRKLPTLAVAATTVEDKKRRLTIEQAVTVCDVCQKKFSSPGHMARHKRTHADERPFVCPIKDCKSAFKRSDHMRQHYRTHLKRLGHGPDDIARLVSSTYADSAMASSPQHSDSGFAPEISSSPPTDEDVGMRAATLAAQAALQQMTPMSDFSPSSLNAMIPTLSDLDWNLAETHAGEREFHTMPRVVKKHQQPGMMFGGAARDDSVSMDYSWEEPEAGPLSMMPLSIMSSDATLAAGNHDWYGFN